MKYITGGFSIFFLLVLLYLLFRLWLEGHRERIAPSGITGETLPAELREDALRPLRQLNIYYEKRDTEQVDAYIDETMLPEELLILGTCLWEIFYGREGAKRLLQGDWKYWGHWHWTLSKPLSAGRAAPYTSSCGDRSDWIACVSVCQLG